MASMLSLDKMVGNRVKYRRQLFEIRHDAKSSLSGWYITAIEEGRVRRGDSQYVTNKWLRQALKKRGLL